jgi:hypothetical protein
LKALAIACNMTCNTVCDAQCKLASKREGKIHASMRGVFADRWQMQRINANGDGCRKSRYNSAKAA